MIHNKAKKGYWGVNHNHDGQIIVLAGDDYNESQTRVVLTVKQAKSMIEAIQNQLNFFEEEERRILESLPPGSRKCNYCNNAATKTLVWLLDKRRRPARIKLPWCGCDLMTALRKIWPSPYPVVEGKDYEILPVEELDAQDNHHD